ncbi:hypothetical protein AGMMS49579_19530 [Spirochaetia bacterium]|nr:hypothetical protein AGMMS49579_19530 [Spirochaetia bacterium]
MSFTVVTNENFKEEIRRKREQNSGENVPHQHIPKMRHYEEIIYEVTLAASKTGAYNIFGDFENITEIETRVFEYPGSLMDALQNRYLRFNWQLCSNLPDAGPNSRTVYNHNTIVSATKINRALRLTQRNDISYETIVVRLVNVREIMDL